MTFRGIRFRITMTAGILVAVVLFVAGTALVLLQRTALTASIDQTLTQRADDIVSLLDEGRPDQFAPSANEGFAQLVAADGEVLASTPNLDGEPSLDLVFAAGGDTIQNADRLQVDDDVFRILSRPVDGGVLYVGTTYDIVSESTIILASALAIVIPVVVLILGVMVWWLVGRTLRPVEAMRSEAASIGSSDLHRRLPEPGTDDEIDRLAATLNQMLDRIQSSLERQQGFVADASHELRTPLTRLRAELELASRSSATQDAEPIDQWLDEVLALQELVEDLLYLARLDAGDDTGIEFSPMDLDDVVLEQGQRIAAHGRVEVNMSQVSGAHIRADRTQMRRVIGNLLQNAERHARSTVAVSLREKDGLAVLVVGDDGPGVPTDGAEAIFDRFARLDAARSVDTGGTGLGLAISREIVERHGGTLSLTNPGDPGARFEVKLPVVDGS